MKVLVCPDKFKGSLTANEVCDAIHLGLKHFDESTEVIKAPLADGGEGTLDLLETVLDLERKYVEVHDPLFRKISAYYLKGKHTAYIEMAKASGLQLLAEEDRSPLHTSTFGTGELITHALDQGVKEIYLLIGGSATNDGGIGMASALGYEFVGSEDEEFIANGAGLPKVTRIGKTRVHHGLGKVKFTVLSDVNNPLTGSNGASYVYGEQKGADENTIHQLDSGLSHLAKLLDNGLDNLPGAGAAGGLGFGAMSFLNAKIESGIETIMNIVDFDNHLKGVDLIITGEGKVDSQTAKGKVISGVAKKALEREIPFSIVCGIVENQEEVQRSIQAESIYPIVASEVSVQQAMDFAFDLVSKRASELAAKFSSTKP